MKRLLLVLFSISLFGCGGGGGEDGGGSNTQLDSPSFCPPGYQSYEDLSENGFGCRSDSNSSVGETTESSEPTGSRSANIAEYEEYEPNDIPENANTVAFPVVTGDTLAGIEITGTVIDISDDSDYFIFSPDLSGSYAIYLCGETCTEHPTDSKVAIRIFDQYGDLIKGNPLNAESTKFLTADLDTGLPYYLQILGFDTEGQQYPYRLVIID